MEDPLPAAAFILLVLLIKGVFALMEAAFIHSRKTWLKAKAEAGDKKYRKTLEAVENPFLFVAALRIGSIFLGVLAGAAGGLGIARFTAVPWEGSLTGGLAIAAVALGAVMLGDLIPKQIALASPERIAAGTLPLIKAMSFLGKPLISLSTGLSALIFKVLRLERIQSAGMTEEELRIALMEGEKSGIMESKERSMVEGVFYLGDRPVGMFMTHRSEITWLDLNADPELIRNTAVEHRDQRYFPVADGNLDEVAGVVSVQDILLALLNVQWPGLKSLMKAPFFVPETLSALKAFESFKKGEVDFLLVMDEYGGFSGILSVQDLIEEIVGQLSAPVQDADALIRQEDGTYLADGGINIDQVAEGLSLEALLGDHQEYHTLAGFILSLAGEIPAPGDCFEYEGYGFKVLDMDGNRIDKALILPPHPSEQDP